MRHPHALTDSVRYAIVLVLVAPFLLLNTTNHPSVAAKFHAQQNAVVTISAASFEATALAPGAIVSAFGAALSTGTEASSSVPLPTTLAGTSVRVKDSAGVERAAGLFFVSLNQINFVIPEATAAGVATLTVQSGAGTSTGTLDVKAVAPAIFTANANGTGAPAAVALRVKANGEQSFETVAQFDAASGLLRPRPLDLSPAGERVFLLLFFTGTLRAADPNNDGNRQESVRLLLGGVAVTPDFAGAQGGLAGLDQMNVELPRSLIGLGRVSLSIGSNGGSGGGQSSNLVEIEIASPAGNAPPVISGFSAATALAGQTLTIQGNGFAGTAANNTVRIGGVEAQVTNAAPTQLTVTLPTGVETSVVTVRTPQGEGRSADPLRIRTSLSGLVENTERAPLKDVTVRVRQALVNTGLSGSFVFPEPQGSALGAIVEVDGSKLPVSPPFGKVSFLLPFTANRDNQIARPITLQQTYGASAQVGGQNVQADESEEIMLSVPSYAPAAFAPDDTQQTPPQIQTGDVTLGLPVGMRFQFPDGATSGVLTLTQVQLSRTPVSLPTGVFSSTIIQITPFGTRFTPGARLTFPNADGFPAGATLRLYRLDQTADSATLGRFIDAGAATVSSDGKQILAPNGTVPEATYYFAALARPTTTVIGRVLDSDRTPARRVLVRVRGQEDFTDGNGGFVIRNVPVNSASDVLIVEASYVRPNFRVDRTESNRTTANPGGFTDVGTLTLPAATSNQSPYILIPPDLTVVAGTSSDIAFVAEDPDSGQTVQVTLNGPPWATLPANGRTIRLSPGANDVGTFGFTLTAIDNLGAGFARAFLVNVIRSANRAPVLTVPGAQTVQPSQPLNFTVSATDADTGQTLVYAASNLPAGASFNAATRQFSWTPSAAQTGTYTVSFTVTDSGTPPLSDTKTVAITVGSTATTGTVTGIVRNAATGQPLAGAAISIANTTLTATSAANGAYTLNNVPPGPRTLTAAATGFAATQFAITVVAGQTLTQNISLSPTLATGQLRITVNWTKDTAGFPDDLDAHLYGPDGSNNCFHVYWNDYGSLTAAPYAALEVDNIELSGHPPTETVQIARQTAGTYRFFIDDYESEYADGIARSRATVQIFGSSGLLRTYIAPSGAGEFWHVFDLNGQNGALTDINLLAADPPASPCGSSGALSVLEHQTTAGPIAQGCVTPTPKSVFLTTDQRAYQWTRVANATVGDVVRVDFLQPNGSLYFTTNITLNFNGFGCFWAWIDIAGANAAGLPGNWQARAYYKDTLIAADNFTINRAAIAAAALALPALPSGGAAQSRCGALAKRR
ncbi:MAG: carboxypeptidase regulatory-like domain-containing protein [Acidobacteria bacterium]|nr:carboxypeptidase regulatory-like domain-containing protein [Acidobacteriota bacterium]